MPGYETVNFGILGAGMAAEFHRQAIEANRPLGARLVGVGHHDPSGYKEIAARFGVPCLTERQLLEREDVDVICVCTPSGRHCSQTLSVARAGKHVLVEKPMALDSEDAEHMISACRRAGVKLGVVLQRRTEPLSRRIKAAIDSGSLGELTLCVMSLPSYRPQEYYESANWRGTWDEDGGGVLINQGIHLIDLLIWYMGNPVESCACAGTLGLDLEVEDTLTASLRFASGALGTITATTTAAPGFPSRLEVYGTRGGIQVEGESVRSWQPAAPGGAAGRSAGGAPLEHDDLQRPSSAGSGADPRDIPVEGHTTIIRDFVGALREDRAPLVDGPEGKRSLEAVLAIYRAAGLLGGGGRPGGQGPDTLQN